MSRRSFLDIVDLSIAVPRGEDGFWTIIRELDAAGPWTVRQVADRTNVRLSNVSHYVTKLRRGGYAEAIGEEINGRNHHHLQAAKVYRLARKPLQAPRLSLTGAELKEPATEQLWRAMKMLKTFTLADLVEASEGVPVRTAYGYVYALCAAGIVRKGGTSFHLVQKLGARAPKVLRAKVVFDPNSKTVIGPSVWIDAWHLGLIDDRRDAALVAFVKRQTGIEHMRWLIDAEDASKVTEALKGWMARDAGVDWSAGNDVPAWLRVPAAKVVLAQWNILAKAGVIGSDFTAFESFVEDHAFIPLTKMTSREWTGVMKTLGRCVRKLRRR